MVLHKPKHPPSKVTPELLYMALFSCVNDTIAICFVGQRYSQTNKQTEKKEKKKGSKWPVNDQIRRRRHTGTQGVRGEGFTGSRVLWG